ncbi:hypothetical protein H8E77_41935 [bacterium]|nr:hypothetical protein [bacterium]
MSAKELLTELLGQGVNIEAVGDGLRIDAPPNVLTSELRQALAEHKQAILTLLSPPAPIAVAPTIQEVDSREKELDEDIDEPSEIQKIAVAPAIEDHQCAWTLACCYLWLTSKNMNERKGVMFDIPRPFRELVNKNVLREVPEEAEWITWNRIHGCAIERFQISRENIKQYKQSLKEVMCLTPHWWREKYLANSELNDTFGLKGRP